jgi:hypothetical protein
MEDCGSKKNENIVSPIIIEDFGLYKNGVVHLSLPWKIVVCKKEEG